MSQLFPPLTSQYNAGRYLVSDFDDGTSTFDTLGTLGIRTHLGVSSIAEESTSAGGDSGGPLFIDGKIAGITSHGASLLPDFINRSFGELAMDTRVSFHAPWIDAIIADNKFTEDVFTEGGPNDSMAQLATADPLPLGFLSPNQSELYVSGTIGDTDTADFFKVVLSPGDIFGAAIIGDGSSLTLKDSSGNVLITSQSGGGTDDSPLPKGDVELARVIDTQGTYFVEVQRSATTTVEYILNTSVHRPVLESQPIGSHQIVYLDFDGADINRSVFGGPDQVVSLSALTATTPDTDFLQKWGIAANQAPALINKIVSTFEEKVSTFIRTNGGNGDYDVSGVAGEFDIAIYNSLDHPTFDVNQPNVSQVIIGGTSATSSSPELPEVTSIGKAEKVDVGNFDTEDTAVITLDKLSGPDDISNPDRGLSLNAYDSVDTIDFVGEAIGRIAAHEAGHLFGLIHTDDSILTPPTINDVNSTGFLNNILGLVGPVWGDGNEVPVNFGTDDFFGSRPGQENAPQKIAFSLPSGKGSAPQVTNVTVDSNFFYHPSYSFATATHNGDAVVGSGKQLATVPVGGANFFTITFSEPVNVTAADLELIGLRTGDNPDLRPLPVGFMHAPGSNVAAWWFENLRLNGDQYLLQLSDSVTNLAGVPLDGEWTNPSDFDLVNPLISTFPSGDGTYGGDFEFVITLMPGDANLDLVVDVTDLGILATYWEMATFSYELADFNGDGVVNVSDLGQLASNNGFDWTALLLFGDLDGDWDVDEDDESLALSLGWTQEEIDIVMEQFGIELEMAT